MNIEKKIVKAILFTWVFAAQVFLLNETVFAGALSPLEGSDVDKDAVETFIIESWETALWDIIAEPGAPNASASAKIIPGRPQALGYNQANKNSLGIKFNFVYPGHNKVVLLPPATNVVRKPLGQLDENNKPKYADIRGLELPGQVEALSVWVLGRGNEYTLEAWVRDWNGNVHVLPFGSIDFVGWRPLKVKLPHGISRKVTSFPHSKETLILLKLVLRSTPLTRSEDVIIFFDSFKALSRIYDVNFDGADMHFDEQDAQKKARLKKYYESLQNKTSPKGY